VPRFNHRITLCRPGDLNLQEFTMTQWIKPQATDLRYGFEITMYISAR
jgi:coenzyme PQQ precursor peptide PqqA